MMQSVPFISDK